MGGAGRMQCSMDGAIRRGAADEAPQEAVWSRFHRMPDTIAPSTSNAIAATTVPWAAGRNATRIDPTAAPRSGVDAVPWGVIRAQRRKAADGRHEGYCPKETPETSPSQQACGPKRKRRPHNADPSPEHKLNAIQQRSLQPQQQQLLQLPLLLRLLQQQQQPQPLRQP